MDRFIESGFLLCRFQKVHLKSNMDRFIETTEKSIYKAPGNLKSNMDRFIDFLHSASTKLSSVFKIQYG